MLRRHEPVFVSRIFFSRGLAARLDYLMMRNDANNVSELREKVSHFAKTANANVPCDLYCMVLEIITSSICCTLGSKYYKGSGKGPALQFTYIPPNVLKIGCVLK